MLRYCSYFSIQPLQLSSITWKPCTDLPIDIHVNSGSATIVNRKIYYGGGFAKISKDGCPDNRVYCYNPVKDCWTLLPSLPVKQFSLGRVDNELVATGGVQKVNEQPTTGDVQNRPKIGQLQKTVYTFDKRGPKWREELRPMLTARCLHCTLSLESSLVVAGGQVFPDRYTNEVEIYKVDANEWYRAKPLPVPFFNFSMALLDDKCYVVGGYNGQELQQVYHANVEALLGSASHHDQAHQTSNPQDAVWKTLPTNTPNSQSAAVAVAGNLLAIAGGQPGEKIEAGEPQSGVYAYSSSSGAWVHVGDLPSPRKICAAIEISPLEVLVIGGWASEKDPFRNDVIKGRLHCL